MDFSQKPINFWPRPPGKLNKSCICWKGVLPFRSGFSVKRVLARSSQSSTCKINSTVNFYPMLKTSSKRSDQPDTKQGLSRQKIAYRNPIGFHAIDDLHNINPRHNITAANTLKPLNLHCLGKVNFRDSENIEWHRYVILQRLAFKALNLKTSTFFSRLIPSTLSHLYCKSDSTNTKGVLNRKHIFPGIWCYYRIVIKESMQLERSGCDKSTLKKQATECFLYAKQSENQERNDNWLPHGLGQRSWPRRERCRRGRPGRHSWDYEGKKWSHLARAWRKKPKKQNYYPGLRKQPLAIGDEDMKKTTIERCKQLLFLQQQASQFAEK